MINFDATLRAMGSYQYIIYAMERAAIISAINYNRKEIQDHMKDVSYHRKNILTFAKQLRNKNYERWSVSNGV